LKKAISFLVVFISVFAINAQTNVQLYQQLASPAHTFKSLSGWHGGVQAGLNYQNLWPGIANTSVGYMLNADIYSEKIHSAFGVNAAHNRLYGGDYIQNSIEAYFSPKLNMKNGWLIMPSASLSLNQHSIKGYSFFSSLPFNDPNDLYTNSMNRLGVGLGLGLIYKNWFGVGDLSSINQADYSFYENSESRKPMRSSFIVGRTFELANFSLMPTLSYMNEGSFSTIKASLNANYKWLTVAGSYDWDNAFAASIGVLAKEKVRFSYSYIMPTSSLSPSSIISHELGLSVIFAKPERGFIKNIGLM
jgi:type IX secretion system PorP/SprF family membrane protein